MDQRMLVVLAERCRQGHFLGVFILALDRSVGLLITQRSFQLLGYSPSAPGLVLLLGFVVELL